MNESLKKDDFVYFRNEILKDMKQIESKINEKLTNLYTYIKKISTDNDQKIDTVNVKVIKLLENDPLLLEEKINSKLEKNKNNFEDKISDLGAKLYILKKDLSNACFKYDKIVLDNLKVAGIIGEGCTYTNLKNYIEFLNKKLAELSTSKEKMVKEFNLMKTKINDIQTQFRSDFENQKIVINDMTSIRINEAEKGNIERIYVLEKQMDNLRLENYNFSNKLIKKTEELNIQWDKLENIKNEIYSKLDEEKISFKKYTDYLSNIFNSQKKEFNLIKSRFTDLSNVIKHLPLMKLNSNNEGNNDIDTKSSKKDILKLAKRLNFNKKQTLTKEDLEILKKEDNNLIKPVDEEDIINEKEKKIIKNNEIILSENLKREDSNYINNINLKENLLDNQEENKMEDNEEKQKELDLENNNINKNNRKNFINDNNSNSVENKNIYTKITIKSLNKKSKDDSTNNVNDANEDINLEKEKHEIPFETNIKNGEINNFSKTLTKNIFLNLKKGNKSLKKINFNKSNERREKKENEKISFQKNNTKKHLLKSEHEKFHEYLSLSNEIKSFNHHTNTTPLNLKLKNIINKKGQKNKEEILPLNLENFLSNENNEKENKYFKRIIEYINMTNHNINEKFQNISAQIGNDISSIKKEINQIYNDANLVTLNNNNRVRKLAPFKIKINNFDLYNNSGIQLNMENFKNFNKNSFIRNKSGDKNFNSEDTPKNILNSIEPYLIKKFKDKVL